MARMFPDFGPKTNESRYAEPQLYHLLKSDLSDEYTVIHSIPWLSSALVEIYGDQSGIGEVDFLVIHPSKGVLAIEVKGGNISRDYNGYYYVRGESKSHFDPYNQLNRGVFAIQEILKEVGLHTRLGKAYYFPKADFGLHLSPEYTDIHDGKRIRFVIDKGDTGNEANRIEYLMGYYIKLLGIRPLGASGVEQIINCLLPQGHNKACWISRIKSDSKTWLKLTDEQEIFANNCIANNRALVTGWPGSGKTIVLIHACRQLAKKGKKTLVVTFNRLLSEKIAGELAGEENCKVVSFNKLCMAYSDEPFSIYHDEATLKKIVSENKLVEFDALFVDEGQAISEEAWKLFFESFRDKQIIAMCDDAQAFGYEKSVSIDFLKILLGVQPYLLTESMRMPKAVCNELKLFSTPYYTVINNRDIESDTLNRVVTHDQTEKLKQIVARLLSDGISKNDICVLKPGYINVPAEVVPAGVEVESIGRFRGLEKPIVIIYSSEMINNAEFFCAYSRATSRCIVILDANYLKKGRYGELGQRLMKADPVRVHKIAEKGLIKNKIQELQLDRTLVLNDLVKLEWCNDWDNFFLYSDCNPVIQELFLSHLEILGIKGVIGWSMNSLNHIRITGQCELDLRSLREENYAELKFCRQCESLTPKQIYCVACSSYRLSVNDKNNLIDKIQNIISLLQKRRTLSINERENICPFLSAAILVMSNQDDFSRPIVLRAIEHSKSYICLIVIIHILYVIFKNKNTGKIRISNKSVISFIKKCAPSIKNSLSSSSFASFVDDGMNKLITLEVLRKVEKGICEVDMAL